MGSATILIVEDFDDTREMMKFVLSGLGYLVLEAANGRHAVQMALEELPDLILMDLAMPELNGFDATREIRNLERTHETPIIALSAFASDDHRLRASAAGCNAYLTKPVDFFYLESVMSQLLKAA